MKIFAAKPKYLCAEQLINDRFWVHHVYNISEIPKMESFKGKSSLISLKLKKPAYAIKSRTTAYDSLFYSCRTCGWSATVLQRVKEHIRK